MKVNPYPISNSSDNPILSDYADLAVFKGKSFLEFNNIIGLPMKNNREFPIFDYELDVIDKIQKYRNIWIKKASGIGATELILRFLAWKILVNNDLEYKNIFIVSGTFVHHAAELKIRMENLFRRKFPALRFNSKFTQLQIKNTIVKIFPSRNVKDLRGYTDVSYLFIDEADHFEPSVNSELLHAITRYEEKSNCTTIMCSTPNSPTGLFNQIEQDKNSKYCKIFLGYQVGLDKIYDRKFIEAKKSEPEFEREYNLKYTGRSGNTFNNLDIDLSIKRYDELKISQIPLTQGGQFFIGLDPASGSSRSAIVVTNHIIVQDPLTNIPKDIIRLVFAEEYQKPSASFIVDLCHKLRRQFNFHTTFFIDSSAPFLIRDLRTSVGEDPDYSIKDISKEDIFQPVVFQQSHKNMLSNLEHLVSKGYLAINPKFDKVITALRSAYSVEWDYKKDQSEFNDTCDALMLSCRGYNIN